MKRQDPSPVKLSGRVISDPALKPATQSLPDIRTQTLSEDLVTSQTTEPRQKMPHKRSVSDRFTGLPNVNSDKLYAKHNAPNDSNNIHEAPVLYPARAIPKLIARTNRNSKRNTVVLTQPINPHAVPPRPLPRPSISMAKRPNFPPNNVNTER